MSATAARRALVTGASSGIGLETASLLLAQGWQVWGTGRPDDDPQPLQALGGRFLGVDFAQPAARRAALESLAPAWADGLHGLVNNAGYTQVGALEALDEEALRRQMEVNLWAAWEVTRACLPALRLVGGRVVNVSSLMGAVAMPALGAYSLSKHALEGMNDAWRLELAGQGVAVCLVQMGAVATPLAQAMPQAMQAAQEALSEPLRPYYERLYGRMVRALHAQARLATPVAQVAQAIVRALSQARPQPRQVVGVAAQGLLLLRRLAPPQVADAILRRALGL